MSALGPADDRRWMGVALALARRGLGRVAPNPAVGCVLVGDGRVLGRGVTGAGGRPHAEAVALAEAEARGGAEALAGATAYVTLEPCAHHGLTPPCAAALAQAGIGRVVCPIEDPDPRVAGRGFALLEQAGIRVDRGLMAEEATRINAGFLTRLALGRPHLTLKLATTLDGRIATAAGESRWITGPEARLRAHAMRDTADLVLVGAGTARADDPMLDVRGMGRGVAQPVRAVADGALSLPLDSRLVRSARMQPLWLLHRPDADPGRRAALEAAGARPMEVPELEGGRLDMGAALMRLAEAGITRVLCEGGGVLASALVAAGLVDEIAHFQAGALIGAEGRPGVGPLALGALAEAPRFELAGQETLGPDTLTLWRRAQG